jgi:hypothetical protein
MRRQSHSRRILLESAFNSEGIGYTVSIVDRKTWPSQLTERVTRLPGGDVFSI